MKILHVGMGWFGQEVGGLSRYMTQAVLAQKAAGHEVRALVTGDADVAVLSGGVAQAFATVEQSVIDRLRSLRRVFIASTTADSPELVTCHF
ncbi:MAG TPA: hypothetical protein PKY05_18105, partial [Fibrobacteria bacterium]|nr:hypothetical protein [Fibrobacteria bacterium]